MRKFMSLVLALIMLFSVAAVASAAETDASPAAAGKATVTLYDIFGNPQDVQEYNVGDTFTCTVFLNTSAIGTIGSLKGNQTYTSSVLSLADAYSDVDGVVSDNVTMFPVTKDQTVANGKLDGKIAYNASTPQMGESGFHFDTDDSVLMCSHFTVTAAGEAEIHNEINTLAVADYYLTRIIMKNVIIDDRFTTKYTLSESTATPDGFTVSGAITSYLRDDDVTVKLMSGDTVVKTVTGKETYSIEDVEAGDYTLRFSKPDHVTRDYDITVSADTVQDAKIHLLGDINGDGKVTTVDFAKANSHARQKAPLTGYELKCADTIGGDNVVTTADAARINSHARNKSFLWVA